MEWNYIFGDFASSIGGRGGEMLYSIKNLGSLKHLLINLKSAETRWPLKRAQAKKKILESPPFIKKNCFTDFY